MPKVGMTFITDSALTAEQIRKARAADTETPRRAVPRLVGQTSGRGESE